MPFYSAFKRENLALFLRNRKFISLSPPGHYYSPIPDRQYLESNHAKLFDKAENEIGGIELHRSLQLATLRELSVFYGEIPFTEGKDETRRYYFSNPVFRYADAIILYSMLRYLRPNTVIEVGSGFSSAVMLDTRERFLHSDTELHFVEPYTERLEKLCKPMDPDKYQIHEKLVQDVDIEFFLKLKKNDILFIDSSHVAKCGSDVNFLLFEVLPKLKAGVYVHFHDVFWPFEYPKEWLLRGRAWNEIYVLRAFLQYNEKFEIVFFNSYLGMTAKELLAQHMPLFLHDTGGSIWIRKKEI